MVEEDPRSELVSQPQEPAEGQKTAKIPPDFCFIPKEAVSFFLHKLDLYFIKQINAWCNM